MLRAVTAAAVVGVSALLIRAIRRSGTRSKRGTLTFNRASKTVPSLYRNGKLGTNRDVNGNDNANFGFAPVDVEVEVYNARKINPSFLKNGVEIYHLSNQTFFESLVGLDLYDNNNVVHKYYPMVEEIARNVVMKEIRENAEQCPCKTMDKKGQQQQQDMLRSKIHVFPFDHNIRHRQKAGKETAEEKAYKIKNCSTNIQKGLPNVHTDYTLTSAPRRLRDLMSKPPTANDTWRDYNLKESKTPSEEAAVTATKKLSTRLNNDQPLIPAKLFAEKRIGRWIMLNVWKSLDVKNPISQFPLSVCDYSTTDPKDFAVFEIHYADRIGENYFGIVDEKALNHEQKWLYFPDMRFDEAIVMKQWDSEGVLHKKYNLGQATDDAVLNLNLTNNPINDDPRGRPDFCLHASPDQHEKEDLPMRRSLEVRCFVLIEA